MAEGESSNTNHGSACGCCRGRQKQDQAHDDDQGKDEPEVAQFQWRHLLTLNFWLTKAVDPNSDFFYYWTFVNMLAVLYNGIFVMLRGTFKAFSRPLPQLTLKVFDSVADIIYLGDMCVRSRRAFLEQGLMVNEVKRLTKTYIGSYYFFVDIFTVFPVDLIAGQSSFAYRFNRCGRIRRIYHFFHMAEVRSRFPKFVRVLNLLIYILIIIHLNACLYFTICKWYGLYTDRWVYPGSYGPMYEYSYIHLLDFWYQYLYCFFWSTLMLTTIGETEFPSETVQTVYCIICSLVGVLIFAAVFGNVGALINDITRKKTEYKKRVDSIKEYMKIHKVPPAIQEKFLKWFRYTWKNKQSVDAIEVLQDLPENIRVDIGMCVHVGTLRDIKLFKFCENGFLEELVLKLRWQVFSPLDYICRKGEIGHEMYIIKRGYLEVLDGNNRAIAKLTDGQIFGEISVLDIPGNTTANRRTADVRAVGYVDLLCLSKKDLWAVLEDFPQAKTILIEKGKNILRKDKYLDEAVSQEAEQQISNEEMIAILHEDMLEYDKLIEKGNEHIQEKGKQQRKLLDALKLVQVLAKDTRLQLDGMFLDRELTWQENDDIMKNQV